MESMESMATATLATLATVESEPIVITNKSEFKSALESYWVNATQIKEVKDQLKAEKKIRMQAVELMKKEVEKLSPAIEKWMVAQKIETVRSRGKTFHLKWKKLKSKMSNDELADKMKQEGVSEDNINIFLQVAQIKKERSSSSLECKVEEESEEE